MKTCGECKTKQPNVGPWEDGRELCGGCKVRVTLARPGVKKRLEREIQAAVRATLLDS